MKSTRIILISLILISATLLILHVNAIEQSPNIFSGEMAYKGQSNAISTGEIAYTGQLNAITSGEIPSVGLFSSQIPKVALLKGAKTINLTKSKPQEVKIHLNLTNESINLILPKNMTNSTSKAG